MVNVGLRRPPNGSPPCLDKRLHPYDITLYARIAHALATPHLRAPAPMPAPAARKAWEGRTLGEIMRTPNPPHTRRRDRCEPSAGNEINGGLRYRQPGLSVICRGL